MTDKEFRHLRRADLIDIIYELQRYSFRKRLRILRHSLPISVLR